MIFATLDGEGVRVEVSPRHQDLIDEVITKFRERGIPVSDIAKTIGRSKEYVYKRIRVIKARESGTDAKEGDPPVVPFFGVDPHWSPEVERVNTSCHRCGGIVGLIHEGSPYVCLACLHSGRDEAIKLELKRERFKARAHSRSDGQKKTFAQRRYS